MGAGYDPTTGDAGRDSPDKIIVVGVSQSSLTHACHDAVPQLNDTFPDLMARSSHMVERFTRPTPQDAMDKKASKRAYDHLTFKGPDMEKALQLANRVNPDLRALMLHHKQKYYDDKQLTQAQNIITFLRKLSKISPATDEATLKAFAYVCYGQLICNEARPNFLRDGYFNRIGSKGSIKLMIQNIGSAFGPFKVGEFVEIEAVDDLMIEELVPQYLIPFAAFLR